MRIHAVYGSDGRILTAFPHSDATPTVGAAPKPGVEAGDFDVPKEFDGKHPREFLHRMRVDVKGKRLVVDTKP
jgi:hypothetical protein